MAKINRFLIEMGGVFAFSGNQFRLEVGGQDFFIDVLLYHRRLKCFVAVELKVGEFKPEYVGKMQFYLAALDDLVKTKEENPSPHPSHRLLQQEYERKSKELVLICPQCGSLLQRASKNLQKASLRHCTKYVLHVEPIIR